MQVAEHKVVTFDYTLTDDDGSILDSSVGQEPLSYLHGQGNIIPGLESALDGKASGDQFQVAIPPADGYGERSDQLVQVVPREKFAGVGEIEIGMQFRVGEEGSELIVTVVEVGDDTVTLDGNHELAGVTLNFDVTVREVRDATDEEIEHGHAHGPGVHHHE